MAAVPKIPMPFIHALTPSELIDAKSRSCSMPDPCESQAFEWPANAPDAKIDEHLAYMVLANYKSIQPLTVVQFRDQLTALPCELQSVVVRIGLYLMRTRNHKL